MGTTNTRTPIVLYSKFPIRVFTDHKLILHIFGTKGAINQKYYNLQFILMRFHNLEIVWTAGPNIPWPDLLSRNCTSQSVKAQLLRHKKVPKEILRSRWNGSKIRSGT